MFRVENFIYFITVNGFFIGLLFGIIKEFPAFEFLFITLVITGIFYILGVASTGFFIKFVPVRKLIYIDKNVLESTIDYQIQELEIQEEFILEANKFRLDLEKSELDFYKEKSKDESV